MKTKLMRRVFALFLTLTVLVTSTPTSLYASADTIALVTESVEEEAEEISETSTAEMVEEVFESSTEEIIVDNTETFTAEASENEDASTEESSEGIITSNDEFPMEQIESSEEAEAVEENIKTANVTSGTLGDNNGFRWTYNPSTKTVTVTGEDSGIELKKELFPSMENVIFKDCKFSGSTSNMFYDVREILQSVKFINCDTSKVTDMSDMFFKCENANLTELDLSCFDTSNVTSMHNMFNQCGWLRKLDISNFDTSNVENMSGMFYDCQLLEEIDVSKFNTSKVSDMSFMFYWCVSLKELDVSKFDTSNVYSMGSMFSNCEKLKELDVSNFDTSNVYNMYEMFSNCSSLKNIDVNNFDTSKVNNMGHMFLGCSNVQSLDVSNFDTSDVRLMRIMFSGCSSLESLDVSNFDTSKVTDMHNMFSGCSGLKSLDVSNFDTSKVTNMYHMFWNCSSLKTLDCSSFDTANVEEMFGMFENCVNLKKLDISNFSLYTCDTTKMFLNSGIETLYCPKYTETDIYGLPYAFIDEEGNVFEEKIPAYYGQSNKVLYKGKIRVKNVTLSNTEVVLDGETLTATVPIRVEVLLPKDCFDWDIRVGLKNYDSNKNNTINAYVHYVEDGIYEGMINVGYYTAEGIYSVKEIESNSAGECISYGGQADFTVIKSNVDKDVPIISNFMLTDTNGKPIEIGQKLKQTDSVTVSVTIEDASELTGISLWVYPAGDKALDSTLRKSYNLTAKAGTNVYEVVIPLEAYDAIAWNASYLWVRDKYYNTISDHSIADKMFFYVLDENGKCADEKEYTYEIWLRESTGVYKCKQVTTGLVTSLVELFPEGIPQLKDEILSEDVTFLGWGTSDSDALAPDERIVVDGKTLYLDAKYDKKLVNVRTEIYSEDCGYFTDTDMTAGIYIEPEATYRELLELIKTNGILDITKKKIDNIETDLVFEGWDIRNAQYGQNIEEILDEKVDTSSVYVYADYNKIPVITLYNYYDSTDTAVFSHVKTYELEKGTTYAQFMDMIDHPYIRHASSIGVWKGWDCSYVDVNKNSVVLNGYSLTYTAQYERLGVDIGIVYYNKNGEYTIEHFLQHVSEGATYQDVNDVVRSLSRNVSHYKGYTFKGWRIERFPNNISTSSTIKGVSKWYYYATYDDNTSSAQETYTITFKGNGATSGTMKTQSFKYDTAFILNENLYKKTGYEFDRWTINADGTGISFLNLEEVLNPNGADNLTLYAQWKPVEYTIDYVLGGDDVYNPNAEKVSYSAAQEAYTLQNPTRPNYTFAGWYSDAKFKTKVTQIKAGSFGDKVFYAKWTANKYTIKFDANGGTGKAMKNLSNCAYDKDYMLTKAGYQKAGYTFAGWNTKEDGTGTAYENQAVINGLALLGTESVNDAAVTFYAQWTINNYDISFAGIEGVDNSVNKDTPATYTVESEAITLKVPSKEGYTFKGWYTDAKYKKAVSYDKAADTYIAVKSGSTGDVTFYAKWTANKYTIKFDANGASGKGMKNLSATYDKAVTLSNVSYKKTGFEFTGWNTQADGSGTAFENKEVISNLAATGTITLYAQWEIATYKIAYHAGAYAVNPNTTATYQYGDALNLSAPEKEGYIFKGWYSDAAFKKAVKKDAATGEYIAIKVTDSGDKAFYAKWQPENLKYNIVFSAGGDAAIAQEDYVQSGVKLGKSTALIANKFAKYGYTFKGWSTEIGGDVAYINKQKVIDISTTEMGAIRETITLYPVFERTEYTITYTNGGAHHLDTSYNIDEDENIDLTAVIPVKPGYTFVGWYTNKNLKDAYRIETLVLDGQTGNKAIYAKWAVNKYDVRFDANIMDISGTPLFGTVTGDMADQNMTYNKQATLKVNGFKLNGYKFTGWNTAPDGSGMSYKDKQKVKNLAEEGIVTLYAQWEKLTYKITYKNADSYAGNDSYDVTMSIYLSKPTKEGYTFVGWYSDAKFKKSVPLVPEFAIAAGSTGNKTFYAKWAVNKYDIVFDANVPEDEVQATGTMADVNNCQYGKNYKLKTNAYQRKGYTFAGWNTKADGSGTAIKDKASIKNLGAKLEAENGEKVVLYAQWTRNEYTITYKLNGGINHEENPGTYTIEDGAITLENPSMDGYKFRGWYADTKGKTRVKTIDVGELKNITLYAMWKKQS